MSLRHFSLRRTAPLRIRVGGAVAGLVVAVLLFGTHIGASVQASPTSALWPGRDLARGVASRADGDGGYILDSHGGLHAFVLAGGSQPAVRISAYWKGSDIARAIGLRADGHSGYVLDARGGLHPFGVRGDMPPRVTTTAHWSGSDVARGVVLRADGESGYVLDSHGGLHPFGVAGHMPTAPRVSAHWPPRSTARGLALVPGTNSGYILDGWGGTHPFNGGSSAPPLPRAGYTPGVDVARSLAVDAAGTAYMVTKSGSLVVMSASPATSRVLAAPPQARGVSFGTDRGAGGMIVDAFGAVTRVHRNGGGTPSPSPTGTPTPSPTGTPTPTPTITPSPTPRPGMKPPLVGVLDRSHQPASQFDSVMGGWVVNVDWADVQPANGDQLTTGAIDQAIAAVDTINARNHSNLGLKLRFFAGQWAPAWVKNLDGAPFTLTDPNNGLGGTVGRWWTARFGAAYNHVQELLAARYDNAPELREVTVSRCTSIYAEPMVRQGSSRADVAALLGAGYTVALDEQCQAQAVAAHSVWQHTRSDLSFNPYQVVAPSGVSTDEHFTEQMMGYCRNMLGSLCGIENNSLSDTRTTGQYPAMYAAMRTYAPGLTIQTAMLPRMHSLPVTLQDAVTLGCSSVELPPGYQTVPMSLLQSIDQALARNPS